MQANIISPGDVVFINCFPTEENDFYAMRDRSDFLNQVIEERIEENSKLSLWQFYEMKFLSFYLDFKSMFQPAGFQFVEKGDLRKWSMAISKHPSLIILFAHNTSELNKDDYEEIEFFDKIVSAKEIEATIPLDYFGIIDLSTCHPDYLVRALQRTRPQITVRSSFNVRINLVFWILLYSCLFECLKKGRSTYVKCFEEAVTLIENR